MTGDRTALPLGVAKRIAVAMGLDCTHPYNQWCCDHPKECHPIERRVAECRVPAGQGAPAEPLADVVREFVKVRHDDGQCDFCGAELCRNVAHTDNCPIGRMERALALSGRGSPEGEQP